VTPRDPCSRDHFKDGSILRMWTDGKAVPKRVPDKTDLTWATSKNPSTFARFLGVQTPNRRIAMQKVVGSSPIIRSIGKPRASGAFSV
jgi:hypothetical protein